MRKEHLLLVVLLVVVLLLLLAQYVWVKATRKVPPEGCIGGRDTNDRAEKVARKGGRDEDDGAWYKRPVEAELDDN
jgi:hypothetical protein